MITRLLLGMSANLIGQLINLAQRLLLVPLFISAWGVNTYSDWLQLTSLAAYFTLLDMGGQIYIINRLTQVFAVRDIHKFREYLHTGMLIFLLLPGIAVALFAAAMLVFPPSSFLVLSAIESSAATGVIIFVALQFALSLSQGLILGVYRASQMAPLGFMLGNLVLALQLVVLASGLLWGARPLLLSLLQILPNVAVIAYCIFDIGRRFPDFQITRFSAARIATARAVIRPSLNFFSIAAAQALASQTMILLVGSLLGSMALVLFSTQRTMANLMRQLLSFVVNSAWPDLTSLDALGAHGRLAHLFRWVLRTTLLGAAAAGLILHFFGAWIFRKWIGHSLVYDASLMDLFLLYVFILVFWSACANLLMAVNRHQALSIVVVCTSAISVASAWIGAILAGLHGMAMAIVLNDLLLNSWVIPLLAYRYNRAFSPTFFLHELAPITVAAVIILLYPITAPLFAAAGVVWWLSSFRQFRASMQT